MAFTYDPTNTTVQPGTYDFFAAVAHEFSEVMGRISGLGSDGELLPYYSPMDLFRMFRGRHAPTRDRGTLLFLARRRGDGSRQLERFHHRQ